MMSTIRRATVLAVLALLVLSVSGALVSAEEPGTITAHKFNDVNGNGVQDSAEPDIEGWLIRIYRYDATGLYVVGEDYTGPDGTVTFNGLVPTRYKVWEQWRQCWEPTTPTDMRYWSHDGHPGYYTLRNVESGQSIRVDFGNTYTCVPEPMRCIDLEKTGPATARPGETITYHFWVKNCGDVPLVGGAQVYDLLFASNPIWDGDLEPERVVEFDMHYALSDDICGPFTNSAWAIGHPPGYSDVTDEDSWTVEIICEPPPGTGTPGYWKNHPEAWPVDEITIGGVTYTKAEAIEILWMAVKGDKTFTMFPALVAAKLNVLIGDESSCIDGTITDADTWMATYGPVGSGVKAGGKSSPWRTGEPLYGILDDYNNGLLCAPSRDVLEP